MKVTIAELKALAKRAGVRMKKGYISGWYFLLPEDDVYIPICNDTDKHKARLILKGIITEREGLL